MLSRKSPDSPEPKYQPTRPRMVQAFFIFAILGLLADFVVCGVLKIVWLAIYSTVYIGLAATIYNYVLESFWHKFIKPVTIGFLAGAAFGHLLFTGWSSHRSYMMNLVGDKPIILESNEFSDQLFVASEKVAAKIAAQPSGAQVPISILVIKNYGCIASFRISTIAGQDVAEDPMANWVWKAKAAGPQLDVSKNGLHEENSHLPWCLIQWF